MNLLKIEKIKSGFTLVEAMIFMLIFAVVSVGFYRTMSGGLNVIRDAKAKIAATEVASEKMETLRNLAYENLGTIGGSVPGLIQGESPTNRSGIEFTVNTTIEYVNDNYDDIAGADLKPNDYKQIRVTVSWGLPADDKKITMVSHIAPPGTEELYNGGILSIEIRQSDGVGVKNAMVKVRDIETNEVKYNDYSAEGGKVYLIGLNPKDRKYEITVTKNGYYPVVTVPPLGEGSSYYPVDEHGSVILAKISGKTIIFDPIASLQIKTQDPIGNAIGNVDFSLEGGRKLGDSVPAGTVLYSYTKTNHHTDAEGSFILSEQSAGKYSFGWLDTANNANYEFWKIWPYYGTDKQSFFANAGQTTNALALLLPKDVPSLFLTVVDKTDHSPISDAKVTVKNESLSYSQEAQSDQAGKVYFPTTNSQPLLPDTEYAIEVQVDGYQTQTQNITVSNLTEQTIEIQP